MALTRSTLRRHRSRGFTLIELLLVIGIIGVLSGIVISAINPKRMLTFASDAARTSHAKQYQNALSQYFIDNGSLPNASSILTGIENARPICKLSSNDSGCISFDALSPKYIVTLPIDPVASLVSAYTGFYVYMNDATHVSVFSLFQGAMRGDGVPLTAPVANLLSMGGQTTCYQGNTATPISCSGTGQEGEFAQATPSTRFTVTSGVVTDASTGLSWQQSMSAAAYDWNGAVDYCASLGSSWRLPNYLELLSIANFTQASGMALYSSFSSTNAGTEWSSTTPQGNTTQALAVIYSTAPSIQSYSKTSSYYVRCVKTTN